MSDSEEAGGVEPSEVATVVTIVHGTWGSETRYPELLSALQSSLPAPIKFEFFAWCGRNHVLARARAADELEARLRVLIKTYPNARQCLLGHSHGGAILLKAVSAPDVQAALHSAVCISTSFLTAELRWYDPRLLMLAGKFLSVPLIFCWIAFFILWPPLQPLSALGLPVVAAAQFVLVLVTVKKVTDYAFRVFPDLYRAFHYPSCAELSERVLLLRVPGDEAALAMLLAQALGRISNLVWGWAYLMVKAINARVLRSSKLFTPIIVLSLLVGILSFTGLLSGPYLMLGNAPSLVILALAGAMSVIAVLIPFVSAVLFVFGGRPLMVAGPYFVLSVEPTPPGVWQVWQLPPIPRSGWRHSCAYQDADALEVISLWLNRPAVQGLVFARHTRDGEGVEQG